MIQVCQPACEKWAEVAKLSQTVPAKLDENIILSCNNDCVL